MWPRNVIFAANALQSTGAGHVIRLIQISKALPKSINQYFFGQIDIDWIRPLVKEVFLQFLWKDTNLSDGIIFLDSYDKNFCDGLATRFPKIKIVQIADRYTYLLPDSKIVFADLPFEYSDNLLSSRVIAHGIEFLPLRQFNKDGVCPLNHARNVLVTTGGIVHQNVYYQLMEEFSKPDYKEIVFKFVGLPESKTSKLPNIESYRFGNQFDVIAASCDTAISAAGTTMWDLLANRILVGLVPIADNQNANLNYAVRSNQALQIFDPITLKLNMSNLRQLLFDSATRSLLHQATAGKYNFLGAQRLIKAISQAI